MSKTMDPERREVERVREIMALPQAVFVFGSNREGIHGAGAAKTAARLYGARRGIGDGISGRSYAIPTKQTWRSGALPLWQISADVERFLDYVAAHPLTCFAVTRIGCGYAGYTDEQMAPMFSDATGNAFLPTAWCRILDREENRYV